MREEYLQAGAFVLMSVAAIWDIRKREIAGWMPIAGAVLSIASCLILKETQELPILASALLPGLTMLGLAFIFQDSLGYGDGLFVLSIGPCFGLIPMVSGIFFAFFFSAILSVVLLSLRKAGRKTKFAFLPFLAMGMGVTYFVL